MPDIDEPRTAVAPGTSASAAVNTLVTEAATSVASWPIQSATSTTCGSERSGSTSRPSRRRPSSPVTATSTAAASTARRWRVAKATSRAAITVAARRGRRGDATPLRGKTDCRWRRARRRRGRRGLKQDVEHAPELHAPSGERAAVAGCHEHRAAVGRLDHAGISEDQHVARFGGQHDPTHHARSGRGGGHARRRRGRRGDRVEASEDGGLVPWAGRPGGVADFHAATEAVARDEDSFFAVRERRKLVPVEQRRDSAVGLDPGGGGHLQRERPLLRRLDAVGAAIAGAAALG